MPDIILNGSLNRLIMAYCATSTKRPVQRSCHRTIFQAANSCVEWVDKVQINVQNGVMYARLLTPPQGSFFLFGPRGTGKSTWARHMFPNSIYIDLLAARPRRELMADPQRLQSYLPVHYKGWVVLDEIQKVPELLDEVHRLSAAGAYKFLMTGSSARKLRRQGVNLLAGRALTRTMHPLTCFELSDTFRLTQALRYGLLPGVIQHADPESFLDAYVQTYLQQEVAEEGLTRHMAAFTRFLEAAALSAGMPLNVSAVARDCQVERKRAEDYFSILEDLLIAYRLPIFSKRAKRRLLTQRKLLFFDVGVYRTIKPRGPLDVIESLDGIALETLVAQHIRAYNAYLDTRYDLFYWHTSHHHEVDLVLYGERGLIAIEIKGSQRVRSEDLRSLRAFQQDYPMAHAWIVYSGTQQRSADTIRILPLQRFLHHLPELLQKPEYAASVGIGQDEGLINFTESS